MENLWKTNGSSASNADFVDIFAALQKKFGQCFNEWDDYINEHVNLLQSDETFNKCNQTAQQLLSVGHEKFKNGNYRAAMETYNKSLCFAESDTTLESIAYGYRSACFMRMKMYPKALIDIRLALKFGHTGRTLLRLRTQLAECQKQMQSTDLLTVTVTPKTSYPVDKDFPCLADVLEIRENAEFGRHLVAKCDIEVGKVIIVSNVLATTAVSDSLTTCRVCTKMEQNFIVCADCSNAVFCNGKCAEQIDIHRLECGTMFHKVDTKLKLPIQTLLMAIDMFPSIDQLMGFVKRYVNNGNGRGIPKAANDTKSKYALFLTLIRGKSSEYIYLAYQVYTTILTFPRIQYMFNTEKKMLFLAHLTLHHVTVIARNSFEHKKQDDIGTIKFHYIYDVLSLINHSCSPNLFNVSKPDDVAHCTTIKPIWTGEQVFINYLGINSVMPLKQRQEYLENWDLRCICERCEFEKTYQPSPAKSAIEADAAFQYVINTCQEKECKAINGECGKRKKLKQQCIQFLNKFGHISWTPEIQLVVHCFTTH